MKHRMPSRLMMLSLAVAGALPQAALARLPFGAALGDAELAELRGGFVTPQGLSLNFSLENVVLVNGELRAHTVLQLAGQGEQTPAALAASLGAAAVSDSGSSPGTGPVDPGAGTTVLASGLQTVIQNSLDQQNIQSIKVFNLEIANTRALQSLGLSNRIQMSVVDALR